MARKRISTQRVVKEIFDKEVPQGKEKNVFFQDRERIVIVGPVRKPEKSWMPFLLFWAAVAIFSALTLNWIFLFPELEHQIPEAQALLRAKRKQARALEARFDERKKERGDLDQFFQWQEEERKSLVSKLRFLRKRLSEGGGGERSDLLWELARLLPPEVWFQEFLVGPRQILIRGYTLDRDSLRGFLKSLADSPRFENPRLLSLEKSPSYYLFEVNADVAQ